MNLPEIKHVSGKGLPIPGADIDTDQIIPARYLKLISFTGIGKYAFYDLRFDEENNIKEHPFNDERYKKASILIVNENFGCGSSREHAPQSLRDYGISALIGESFAEIFAGNCTALGIPTAKVDKSIAEEIQSIVQSDPDTQIDIDLPTKTIRVGNKTFPFTMQKSSLNALINGTWDSTEMLLAAEADIQAKYNELPYINAFAKN